MPLQTRALHLLTTPDRIDMFARGERCATYRYGEGLTPGFVSLAAPGERLITQSAPNGLGLWLAQGAEEDKEKKRKGENVGAQFIAPNTTLLAVPNANAAPNTNAAPNANIAPNPQSPIANRQSTIVSLDMMARRGTYSVGFRHECAWLDGEGELALTDRREVRVASGPCEGAILDMDLRLQAPDTKPVLLGGAEDALLCLRAADALFDSGPELAGMGQARNSLGEYGMANLHGRRAGWCACVGVVQGETVGFAFLEHPDNPTFPSPWIARPDGVLSPSPFAWRSLTLAPGESLSLRYRLLIYVGYVNQGWADERLADFARGS